MDDTTDDSLLGGRIRLLQPAKGHRVGTDAVLLAASAPPVSGGIVLDVGAATGAVGLMVAARSPSARFVFIERDPVLAALCECNIKRQSIDGAVIAADVLDKVARTAGPLRDIRADLVLTNPPFLDEERSRVSPDANRAAAHSLPAGGLDAWLRACAALLEPKGMLVLIHRSDRIADCVAALSGRVGGLALRFVHPGAGEPAIRVIISGVKGSRAPLRILPPVFLHQADGAFTAQAAAIHQGEAYLA